MAKSYRTMGLTGRLDLDAKAYDQALAKSGKKTKDFADKAEKETKEVDKSFAGLGASLGMVGGKFGALGNAAAGVMGTIKSGAGGAATAIAGIGIAAGAATIALRTAWRAYEQYGRVDTLTRRTALAASTDIEGARRVLPQVDKIGSDLAVSSGIPEEQIQPALYDALAVMGNLPDAVEQLELAIDAWWLAGTDIQTGVKTFNDFAQMFGIATEEYLDTTLRFTESSKINKQEFAEFAPQFLGRGAQAGFDLQTQAAIFGATIGRIPKVSMAAARTGEMFSTTSIGEQSKFGRAVAEEVGMTLKEYLESGGDFKTLLLQMQTSLGESRFGALLTSAAASDVINAVINDTTYDRVMSNLEQVRPGMFREQAGFARESSEQSQLTYKQMMDQVWQSIGEAVADDFSGLQDQLVDITENALPAFKLALRGTALASEGANWFLEDPTRLAMFAGQAGYVATGANELRKWLFGSGGGNDDTGSTLGRIAGEAAVEIQGMSAAAQKAQTALMSFHASQYKQAKASAVSVPTLAGWDMIAAGARLAQSAGHYLQGRDASQGLVDQARGIYDYFASQFEQGGLTAKESQTLRAMSSGINRLVALAGEAVDVLEEPESKDLRLYRSDIRSTDDLLVGG